MTVSNNGRSIALVIIIVILALFAFRSIFFVMPFGIFPGIARSISGVGHSFGDWSRGFGPLGAISFVFLPVALIILWGAVLIWVYRDAEKRGMSGILWLLLVLIGNVIGLLIYAIVRSETPVKRQADSAGSSPAPEQCPACNKSVDASHSFCPYCGKNLKPTCPACGKNVDGSWKVCPACGVKIDPGQPPQA